MYLIKYMPLSNILSMASLYVITYVTYGYEKPYQSTIGLNISLQQHVYCTYLSTNNLRSKAL